MVPCSDTGACVAEKGVIVIVACVVLSTRVWSKQRSHGQ